MLEFGVHRPEGLAVCTHRTEHFGIEWLSLVVQIRRDENRIVSKATLTANLVGDGPSADAFSNVEFLTVPQDCNGLKGR